MKRLRAFGSDLVLAGSYARISSAPELGPRQNLSYHTVVTGQTTTSTTKFSGNYLLSSSTAAPGPRMCEDSPDVGY
jgi:hypothetical protein